MKLVNEFLFVQLQPYTIVTGQATCPGDNVAQDNVADNLKHSTYVKNGRAQNASSKQGNRTILSPLHRKKYLSQQVPEV